MLVRVVLFVFFIVKISFIKKHEHYRDSFFFFMKNILHIYFTHSLYLVNILKLGTI